MMMKRLNLKGLHVGSPRKDACLTAGENAVASGNQLSSFGCQHNRGCENSIEDPAGYPNSDFTNDSYPDNSVVTPKRKVSKGILKTLRRKFTPSRKKDENLDSSPSHNSRTSRWHEEHHSLHRHDRYRRSGSQSADRASVRNGHTHNSTTQYPGSLTRPRKANNHLLHSRDHHRGKAKSDDELGKDNKETPRTPKSLFPFDNEYGHASAPFNEDDNENNIPHGFQGTPLRVGTPPLCSTQDSPEESSSPGPLLPSDVLDEFDNSSGDSQHSIGIVRPPPNVYDQVKDPPKESWSLSKELFKLSKFGWYWGPITRLEAEEKLVGHPDGAFLVRDSSDERYLLSLSFCSYGRTLHTRIEHCNGVFSFYAQPECEGYSSIVDLIEHSMNDSQTGVFCYSRARTPGSPSFPVRLTKPVSRFTQVRTLQYLCRFVIRQYTRFDHIQTLPLPTSIKGWLLENQY